MSDDLVNEIIEYESGEMDSSDTIIFFQKLIDSGLVWSLQGSYGRMASVLIEAGICKNKRN